MANGDKSRRRNASLQNVNTLQGYENQWDQLIHEMGINRLETDLVNESRMDAYNFQNETANFQYEELIRQYDRQRHIYGLNENAIDMEVAYQQQQIYDNVDAKLQELAYAQQDLDFSFAAESIKNNYAQANNELALKTNKQELLINKYREKDNWLQVANNWEQTDQRGRQFGTDMKDMSVRQTAEKAEARRNLLKSSLETQAKAGNAQASGRRGQSARMLEQSIESVAAIDHYALYTQLERGEDSFDNIVQGTTNKKKSDDTQAGIQRKQLGVQRGIIGSERKVLHNQRDRLKNNKREMAQLFGLTVEQYEADTEKLGRMMVDQVSSIDSQLNRLSQQEYTSRINLYAKMPLPPRMAPRAKPPREIPDDKYAFPTDPFRMDHNVMGAAPEQKKPSAFSSFLGIAGTIAGVAGTVLTAGAAGPGVAAAWGAGLSGGGSVLKGLGGSGLV